MADEFDRFLKVLEKYQKAKAEAENPPPPPGRVPVPVQPEAQAFYYAEKLKEAHGNLRRTFARAVAEAVLDDLRSNGEIRRAMLDESAAGK